MFMVKNQTYSLVPDLKHEDEGTQIDTYVLILRILGTEVTVP